MKKIILRMDDVGASSKKYEVYSKIFFGNFLFLKYYRPFKAMGPYEELTEKNWDEILNILQYFNAKLTIGLTAGWVDKNNNIIPFNEKFPKQAKKILEGVKHNIFEVANHGLTHCIVGEHLPRFFSSNRRFHREFWDFIDQKIHDHHIFESQRILQDWLKENVVSFVPPGNVYSKKTLNSIKKTNIIIINSTQKIDANYGSLKYIDEQNIFSFHDKELANYGSSWLKNAIANIIEKNEQINFLRLKDL